MGTLRKNRITIGTFDFIKGIAMINIVVGHTLNVYDVKQSVVLSGVAMLMMILRWGIIPLFFIISGYGFKGKDAKVMLKKTFSDLIIPYLWIVAAYAVIAPVFVFMTTGSLLYTFEQTASYVVSMLLGNTAERIFFGVPMPWWLPSWYILSTFVAFNVLNLVLKLGKVWKQIVAVLLCAAAGYALFELNFHYFCLSQGLIGASYCYLGYALKKFDLLERLRTNVWTYVILVPIAVAELIWGEFSLCGGDFNNVVLDHIGAGCTALLFMLVGIYLGRLEWKSLEWIKQIGIYTYWVVCIHTFEANGLPWWELRDCFTGHVLLGFVIEMILRVLLIMVVCTVLKEYSKYSYRKKLEKNRSK